MGPPPPPERTVIAPETSPAAVRGFDPLAKGSIGVSFGLPGDTASPSVGVTYFIANDLAARLDFALNAVFSSPSSAAFSIALELRSYQLKRGPVAVYLAPSFTFGRTPVTAIEGAEFIAFGGAVGAEYFFTPHLSAGGQLGLAFQINNIGGPATTSA